MFFFVLFFIRAFVHAALVSLDNLPFTTLEYSVDPDDDKFVVFDVLSSMEQRCFYLGHSSSGGMKNAEIFYFDVEDQSLQRLYSNENQVILLSQNQIGYEFLDFYRISTSTSFFHLRFRVLIKSCFDPLFDFKNQQTFIIYATSSEKSLYYNFEDRGVVSINIFDTTSPPTSIEPVPGQLSLNLQIQSKQIEMTNTQIDFWRCQFFSIPNSTNYAHIINSHPVITSDYVKNMVLYACDIELSNKWPLDYSVENSFQCSSDVFIPRCTTLFFGWSDGENSFSLPDDVGLPFGQNHRRHFLIHIHYINPNEQNLNFMDQSGFKLDYLTESNLRSQEADLFILGISPSAIPLIQNNLNILKESFTTRFCTEFWNEGITIFGVGHYMTDGGKSIKLNSIRSPTEISIW